MIYKPVDYLVMILALFGAIYLGGIGAPTLGGLYWKRGTTQGAYASLVVGATVALLGQLLQQTWAWLAPRVAHLAGVGPVADYLAAHASRCPLNGQILAFISIICAGTIITGIREEPSPRLPEEAFCDLRRVKAFHPGRERPAVVGACDPVP